MSLATSAAAGRWLASPTRRPWMLWRSPKDQPHWARPALLVVATLAGLSYSWGIGNFALEPFYGAAVRSMGSSWHDFAFGAVDPAGTVTLDKLPGAFWVQALFVRLLGFHYWVVALPQVLAGVLTVLVLYRAVRRLGGARAGIVAAAVFAASPAATLAMRGNVADPILVLLIVLAADATTAAITDGRPWLLLLAGVLIGLAFQVKMVQAWLVLPPLFLAYLVAAPPRLGRRAGHVVAAGAIAIVVSLSWMSVVAAIPANRRPYVDGTTNDSVFSQVFVYNGVSRIGLHIGAGTIVPANSPFLRALNSSNPETATLQGPSPDKLFVGALGRDGGWLLALALVIALAVLVERRRAPRGDRQRAAVLLWGGWLVVLAAFFSSGRYINSYYLVALAPAIAALCGIGLSAVWDGIARRPSRLALAGLVAACAGYAAAPRRVLGGSLVVARRPRFLYGAGRDRRSVGCALEAARSRPRRCVLARPPSGHHRSRRGAGSGRVLDAVPARRGNPVHHDGTRDLPASRTDCNERRERHRLCRLHHRARCAMDHGHGRGVPPHRRLQR